MEDLVTFIDSLAMDDQLFWQLPHAYRKTPFELVWKKQDKAERWALRRVSEANWDEVRSEDLPALLQRRRVDLDASKRIIGASIVTQAVYASLVVEAAEKIFGKATLQQAFSDTNRFLANLLRRNREELKGSLVGTHQLHIVKK